MGRRGPAPTPTRLKLLSGNPGKRPLNDAEPKPDVEEPNCPTWLDKEAKAEWRRICPELMELGVIAKIDRAALAIYCRAWSRWKQAEQLLMREGLTIESPSSGLERRHPGVTIAHDALGELKSLIGEFGLSPASRTRLRIEKATQKLDELDLFMMSRTTAG